MPYTQASVACLTVVLAFKPEGLEPSL